MLRESRETVALEMTDTVLAKLVDLAAQRVETASARSLSSAEAGFPTFTKGGKYVYSSGWASGFLAGSVMTLASLSGRDIERWRSFARALIERVHSLEACHTSQDVGYIYVFSAAQLFREERDEGQRAILTHAVNTLLRTLHPSGLYFRCDWKSEGENIVGIDSLMNVLLLLESRDALGEQSLEPIARRVIDFAVRTLQCADGRFQEYARLEPGGNGRVLDYPVVNALSAETCWSRGQAWAVYGLARASRACGEANVVAAALRAADYLVAHISADGRLRRDLALHGELDALVDASASAIAACGLLLLVEYRPQLLDSARRLLFAMLDRDVAWSGDVECILSNVSTPLRSLSVPGEGAIWGDFFLLEAIRLWEANADETN